MTTFPPFGVWATAYTPTIPKTYWDVKSQEQRILSLALNIDRLIAYSNDLADGINDINQEELPALYDRLHGEIENLKDIVNDLLGYMDENEMYEWNVQHGYYDSTVQAQRDMFNDVTVHSITCKRLAQLDITVKELSECGLSVRGLAVLGRWLFDKFDLPMDFQPHKPDTPEYLVDDLEASYIDDDNYVYTLGYVGDMKHD